MPAAAADPAWIWTSVAIEGGGLNSTVLAHPAVPDLIYARQDTAGVLRWDAKRQCWVSLMDWMPARFGSRSCHAIAVDPAPGSDERRRGTIYASFGAYVNGTQENPEGNALYRSFDYGATWTRIWDGARRQGQWGVPILSFGGNLAERRQGEALAVDPANPDVLYVATLIDGVYRSLNARAAKPVFTKLTNAPTGFSKNDWEPTGVRVVWVDSRGGTVGTPPRSRLVFLGVASKGSVTGGVWRSQDGGETFTRLEAGEAPTSCRQLAPGPQAGTCYVAGENGLFAFNGTVWRVLPGTAGKSFGSVDSHPADRRRIVAAGDNKLWQSEDGGATWRTGEWKLYDNPKRALGLEARATNWLDTTFLQPAHGKLAFDPFQPKRLWCGDAFSIMRCEDRHAPTVRFEAVVRGYETTVPWALCSPPTGEARLFVAMADVNGMRFTDPLVSPRRQLVDYLPEGEPRNRDAVICDIEAAPSDPQRIVVLRATQGGYSSAWPRLFLSRDNGLTYVTRTLPPPEGSAHPQSMGPGKVAISATDPNHMVVVGFLRRPHYTTNAWSANCSWQPGTGIPWKLDDLNPIPSMLCAWRRTG
ncbi:MAG: hypothetical protein N3J91_16015 [Verrucomicrobiae bacterium]|nr:hypothetical protein [Verrucomicrobiae bacterium]